MRDLISCLSIWLGEPSRRAFHALVYRLDALLTPPPEPPVYEAQPFLPAYACRPPAAHVRERTEPINAHTLDLVRPYMRAHEQHNTADTVRGCA